MTASENANVSYPAQTADAIDDPPFKWGAADGTLVLDGTWHPAPAPSEAKTAITVANPLDGEMGWWGSTAAAADGTFAAGHYPTLTVSFAARPVASLLVAGDSMRDEYPTAFSVYLYDASGTLLHQQDVTGNAAAKWSIDLAASVIGVTKSVLEIHAWSTPGRGVKILEFYASIQATYEGPDILSVDLLEERDVSEGSLPVGNISANEITIRINNATHVFDADNATSPLYGLLKSNRHVRAWLGVVETGGAVEYCPLGEFWSSTWDADSKSVICTMVARDRLELLRLLPYYQSTSVQQNATLYALAVDVLTDAGLTADQYSIDTALQTIAVPYAWFDPSAQTTHREALRLIAEAGLAVVYCDRDGIIQMQTDALLGATSVLTLAKSEYFGLRNPQNPTQVANTIQVPTSPLTPLTSQTVYQSATPVSVPAGGSVTVTVLYSQTPALSPSASLSGAGADVTISASSLYGWGADITLHNAGAAAETATIVVTGQPLQSGNSEWATATNSQSVTDDGTLLYQFATNPLVQTLARAQAIADALVASWADPRREADIDWRGNPALLLGDRITVTGLSGGSIDYHVIRQEFEYAGALSEQTNARKVE